MDVVISVLRELVDDSRRRRMQSSARREQGARATCFLVGEAGRQARTRELRAGLAPKASIPS